jgi:hypothetical protein
VVKAEYKLLDAFFVRKEGPQENHLVQSITQPDHVQAKALRFKKQDDKLMMKVATGKRLTPTEAKRHLTQEEQARIEVSHEQAKANKKMRLDKSDQRNQQNELGRNDNPVLNGDHMPALHLWKDNAGYDYSALVILRRPLRYAEIAKLIPFLLDNGLSPEMTTEFLRARGLIDGVSDWGSVISKFAQADTRAFYYDITERGWYHANGVTHRKLNNFSLRRSSQSPHPMKFSIKTMLPTAKKFP